MSGQKSITGTWIFTPEGWIRNGQINVGEEGRISRVQQFDPGETTPDHEVLLPGFVNAHSHAFQFGLRGHFQEANDFNDWVESYLYPYAADLSEERLKEISRRAFRAMAKSGISTVGEFHYIHNRPDGTSRGNRLDRLVLEAAREVGLRTGFIRCFYDRSGPETRRRFIEEVPEARSHFRELYEAYASDPKVNVLPGPHSVHGATEEMLRAGADLAEEFEVPYHVHISEQQDEVRKWKSEYEATPLEFIDRAGALNEWFVGVHGCWLTAFEVNLLADRALGIVTCPTTNMALGDGVTPLTEMYRKNSRVGLGSDCHQRIDMMEEARLAEWLQRLSPGEMNQLGSIPGAGDQHLSRRLLEAATCGGGALLGFKTGTFIPGHFADIAGCSISEGGAVDEGEPPSLEEILFCCDARQIVETTYVGGEVIFEDTSDSRGA